MFKSNCDFASNLLQKFLLLRFYSFYSGDFRNTHTKGSVVSLGLVHFNSHVSNNMFKLDCYSL